VQSVRLSVATLREWLKKQLSSFLAASSKRKSLNTAINSCDWKEIESMRKHIKHMKE
jgi:hypothetical protein